MEQCAGEYISKFMEGCLLDITVPHMVVMLATRVTEKWYVVYSFLYYETVLK
jgi:hypothetical protein